MYSYRVELKFPKAPYENCFVQFNYLLANSGEDAIRIAKNYLCGIDKIEVVPVKTNNF